MHRRHLRLLDRYLSLGPRLASQDFGVAVSKEFLDLIMGHSSFEGLCDSFEDLPVPQFGEGDTLSAIANRILLAMYCGDVNFDTAIRSYVAEKYCELALIKTLS